MHYIRLLRPPGVSAARGNNKAFSLSLVLTITTDLGESFLCPDAPVELSVVLEAKQSRLRQVAGEEEENKDNLARSAENLHAAGGSSALPSASPEGPCHSAPLATSSPTSRGSWQATKKLIELTAPGKNGKSPLYWRAGMRVLKLELTLPGDLYAPLSGDGAPFQGEICIKAADPTLSASSAHDILAASRGQIMPLWVDLPAAGQNAPADYVALRRIQTSGSAGASGEEQQGEEQVYVGVEEEIGESIARHVWDAGLMSIAFLADVCLGHSETRGGPLGRALREEARTGPGKLQIIELGSGVGILGIGLAAVLANAHSWHGRPEVSILLTDLPEAEERAMANINRFRERSAVAGLSRVDIDYENMDWEDGRRGSFGTKAASARWDLVVLSDCTYNVDMLPALVETLSSLHTLSSRHDPPGSVSAPSVLLATKPRHPSERALFDLMAKEGWRTRESTVLRLPVLGAEAETVELYLFAKG